MLQTKIDGVGAGKLTSSSTPVSNLVFTEINTGNSLAVKINMSLQTFKDKATTTENFETVYVLRGSY